MSYAAQLDEALEPFARRGALPDLYRYRTAATGSSRMRSGASRMGHGAGHHGVVWQRLPRAWGSIRRCWRRCTRRLDATGAGSGGTRNISGTTVYHKRLECGAGGSAPARRRHCCSRSAYIANDATLSTLPKLFPGPHHLLRSALNHASMIEGVRRNGGAKRVFRHNDVASPARAAGGGRSGRAQADRLRIGLLDGWGFRPDRGDLRSGGRIRRPDLHRRGARGRHVRAARRGCGRTGLD